MECCRFPFLSQLLRPLSQLELESHLSWRGQTNRAECSKAQLSSLPLLQLLTSYFERTGLLWSSICTLESKKLQLAFIFFFWRFLSSWTWRCGAGCFTASISMKKRTRCTRCTTRITQELPSLYKTFPTLFHFRLSASLTQGFWAKNSSWQDLHQGDASTDWLEGWQSLKSWFCTSHRLQWILSTCSM